MEFKYHCFENQEFKNKSNLIQDDNINIQQCVNKCEKYKNIYGGFSINNGIVFFNKDSAFINIVNLSPMNGSKVFIPIPYINNEMDPTYARQMYIGNINNPSKPWFIPGNRFLNENMILKKPGFIKISNEYNLNENVICNELQSLLEYIKTKVQNNGIRNKYLVTTYKNEQLIVEELDNTEMMILMRIKKKKPKRVNCLDPYILMALGVKKENIIWPKVAIIFFGLTRSLENIYTELKENVFNPIIENDMTYDIFIHTYKINGKYVNKWTGESEKNYNNDSYKILNAKHVLIDDQDKIINKINFEEYYSKEHLGDWFNCKCENMNTEDSVKYLIRNMVLALYSKKQITEEFEKYKNDYDYVIMMRPDLKFQNTLSPIKIMKIINNDGYDIILPVKDTHNGCNDRLVISKPDNIIYYGKLLDHLLDYSKFKSIVSEIYLLDKLKEKNIKIIFDPTIQYSTIRVNGSDQTFIRK